MRKSWSSLALLLMCVLVLILSGVSNASENNVVFPVNSDGKWTHLEGSRGHTFNVWGINSDIARHFGHRFSDLYALDLSGGNGTDVRPIALGVVEWVQENYGLVVIKHNTPPLAPTPIKTSSDFINAHVEGQEWYSGYMHMRNISVGRGQTVTTDTILGKISNVTGSGSVPVHLHFAVYDKDMYSFSPWLLSDVFRENKITYKDDGGVNSHYKGDDAVLGKYKNTKTDVWFGNNSHPNYRSDVNQGSVLLGGNYVATGGHYDSIESQTNSPLENGSLTIDARDSAVGKDWLHLNTNGRINFKSGAWLSINKDMVYKKEKVGNTPSGNPLQKWDGVNTEHIYYSSAGYRPVTLHARYTLTQKDQNTLELLVEHIFPKKYSNIVVTFQKSSAQSSSLSVLDNSVQEIGAGSSEGALLVSK
ncbi:hypothetical protein FACS1894187_20700 [Synergistales bacterium]|nr:hypothetical protein FACS1894187_20700 [Synergistales bacterium]